MLQFGPIRVGSGQNLATNVEGREKFTRKKHAMSDEKESAEKNQLVVDKAAVVIESSKENLFCLGFSVIEINSCGYRDCRLMGCRTNCRRAL